MLNIKYILRLILTNMFRDLFCVKDYITKRVQKLGS